MQGGGKMKLKGAMFASLSNCKPEFFELHWERIVKQEVSLEDVLENSTSISETQTVKVTIASEALVPSFEALKVLFFDPAMLKESNNIGARIDPNHIQK